jgi:hypothetical protein
LQVDSNFGGEHIVNHRTLKSVADDADFFANAKSQFIVQDPRVAKQASLMEAIDSNGKPVFFYAPTEQPHAQVAFEFSDSTPGLRVDSYFCRNWKKAPTAVLILPWSDIFSSASVVRC